MYTLLLASDFSMRALTGNSVTSRGGIVPITPRMDTVGPIARSVTDAAILLSGKCTVSLKNVI